MTAGTGRKANNRSKPATRLNDADYTGALAEPIRLPAPAGWLVTAEQWADRRQQLYEQAFRDKVPLLFEHFQIPPGDWQWLALALAQTHVPGLRSVTPERRGPKRFWTLSLIRTFVAEMQAEMNGPKKRTISDAANTLARRQEWKDRLKGHSKSAEVLRRKYHELMETSGPPPHAEKPVKQLVRSK